MQNKRGQRPDECAGHVRHRLGALLDELDGEGDPLPEDDQDEGDHEEDDAEDDGEGEPGLGLVEEVPGVVEGEVDLWKGHALRLPWYRVTHRVGKNLPVTYSNCRQLSCSMAEHTRSKSTG